MLSMTFYFSALFIFKLIQGLSGAENSVTHTVEEFQRAFQVHNP